MKTIFLLIFISLNLFASSQKVTLQLEWKHQFEFAGFYAAKAQGYYKEIGLDVEIKEFHGGINIVDEVLSQKAEFGISSSSLVLNKLQNKPVVLLASYFKQNALALVAKPEIKTPKQLLNKKIMATPYEIKYTSLAVMLKEAHLNESSFTLVPNTFRIDKFVNGEVDAMSVFTTNQLYLLDKQAVPYTLLNPSSFGIYSYDVELFTSQNYALENPELVKKFTLASNKGWEYAFKHKSEIVDLIYEKYSQQKSKKALMYEAKKTESLFKRSLFKIGAVVPELITLNTVIYKKLGLISNDFNIHKLLDEYIFNYEPKEADQKTIDFTNEELDFINQNRVFNIANEINWFPFDYNELGKAKGFSIDYIELLFLKAGLKYKYVNGYTWKELIELFKKNKIDILPAFYKNEQREKFTLYSTPYYENEVAIYTLKENNFINSATDLKGKKIGIEMADATTPIAKKHLSDSTIVECASMNEVFTQLQNHQIDAIISNPLLVKHKNDYSSLKLIANLHLSAQEQKNITLHVGVSKKYPLLHSILQKTMNTLTNHEIQKLKYKWIEQAQNNMLGLSAKEQEYLSKNEITMCVDPDWMPFEKLEYSQHIGMTADYFKIIEKSLNKKISVIPTETWTQSLEFAKKRKCDLFSLAASTPKRDEYMNFTTPYLNIPLVIATNFDVPFISDFNTLSGKTVGIAEGYAYVELLKIKYPNINIVEVKNIRDGLNKVKQGKLFGYIGTLASIAYNFQTEFTNEFKIAGKFDEKWELGIGVRNDDTILFGIMQKAIKNISKEQSHEIMNKWIAVKYENRVDYSLFWKMLFISILILLAVLFWLRKLALVNKNLQIAKKKAEEATQAKANFLSNMSHEIRTPMNAILGLAYLIGKTPLTNAQSTYIKKIQHASNNLLRLINDILDFSKIEAHKLELHSSDFNLEELLNDLDNIMRYKANEKGLKYTTTYEHINMNRYGDDIKLLQILTNLTSNAIKFTHKGEIEVLVEMLENNQFKFSVRDTGIGIDQENQEKLFQAFTQVDASTTRNYGGTGLGLSISKELVKLMDGSITLDSKIDLGTTVSFEITLPPAKEELSSFSKKKSTQEVQTNKIKIDQSKQDSLFRELYTALKSRRPKLCKPILQEMDKYDFNETTNLLYTRIKHLTLTYQFDEAWSIIDEKYTNNTNS